MKYLKDKFEKILNEEIVYTTDKIGNYIMYNYSLKEKKYLIANLKFSETIIHIELLILPEEYRRKGIGTKIVNIIKNWAIENDYNIIELVAIHESRLFWEKQGFKMIKENNNTMILNI